MKAVKTGRQWCRDKRNKYVVRERQHVLGKGKGKTVTCPPLGWYFIFSVEPILDLMFLKSGRGWLMMRSCLGVVAGDLGGVRTTATFLSWEIKLRERGVPGVLEDEE